MVQMDCLQAMLTSGQPLWLVSLLDDHSRFILDSRFVPAKTMDEAMGAFREAVKKWGLMDRLLTDEGSEFVSWSGMSRFEQLLASLDVELVTCKPHMPYTLGKLERWHETFRTALREHGPLDYSSQAQLFVRETVAYYNYERPHEALGGLVPADRFFGLAADLAAELSAYREHRRRGQQIYVCCRLGERSVVISGPRLAAAEMVVDGRIQSWPEANGCVAAAARAGGAVARSRPRNEGQMEGKGAPGTAADAAEAGGEQPRRQMEEEGRTPASLEGTAGG
jgi:hypothetical protein